MLGFIVHILIATVLLFVVGQIVSGIEVKDGKAALLGAIGLGIANALVRPLLLKLTLPITIITFGLSVWFVNAAMLMLAAAFVDGFEVEGFKAALWGSALLGLMHLFVGLLPGF